MSIKRCYHQTGGGGQDAQGRYCDEGPLWAFLETHNSDVRVVSSVDITDSYDLASPPSERGKGGNEAVAALLRAIEETFGLSIVKEEREIPVLLLSRRGDARLTALPSRPKTERGLEQSPSPIIGCADPIYNLLVLFRPYQPTRYTLTGFSMRELATMAEANSTWAPSSYGHAVVIDETHLEGGYDFELLVDRKHGVTIGDAVRQIGLELVPGHRRVNALYVDVDPRAHPTVALRRLDGQLQVFSAWDELKH